MKGGLKSSYTTWPIIAMVSMYCDHGLLLRQPIIYQDIALKLVTWYDHSETKAVSNNLYTYQCTQVKKKEGNWELS